MTKTVVIDGVRYVPVADITPPAVSVLGEALEALYWGDSPNLREKFPGTELYLIVTDDPSYSDDPLTVRKFTENLAVRLGGMT